MQKHVNNLAAGSRQSTGPTAVDGCLNPGRERRAMKNRADIFSNNRARGQTQTPPPPTPPNGEGETMSDGNAQAGPWFLEPLPWEERKGLLWGFPKTVWLLFRHPFQSFQRSDASTLWGTLLFLLVVGLLYGAVQGVDRLLHYYVFHPEMLKWAVEQFPSYKDALPVFLFLRSVANAMVCTLFFVAPVTVILFVCLKDNSISKLLGKSTLRIAVYCLPTLFLTIGTTTGYQVQAIMGLLILIGGIRAIAPAIRNWAPLVAVSAIFAHHAFWVVWDYLIWGPEAAYQTIYSTLFTLLYPLLSP